MVAERPFPHHHITNLQAKRPFPHHYNTRTYKRNGRSPTTTSRELTYRTAVYHPHNTRELTCGTAVSPPPQHEKLHAERPFTNKTITVKQTAVSILASHHTDYCGERPFTIQITVDSRRGYAKRSKRRSTIQDFSLCVAHTLGIYGPGRCDWSHV